MARAKDSSTQVRWQIRPQAHGSGGGFGRRPRRRALWCSVAAWAVGMSFVGCKASVDDSAAATTSTVPHPHLGDLATLEVTRSEVVPTVVWVEWTTEQPGAGWVEAVGAGETIRTPTLASDAHHRVSVLGLKAGQSYEFRAVTERSDGTQQASGLAPMDTLAPLGVADVLISDYDPESVHDAGGFYALATRTEQSSLVVVLDRDGDVVWFTPAGEDRQAFGPKLAADGVSLVWMEWDAERQVDKGRIVRMRLDGEATEVTRTPWVHHDFIEHADGALAFLSLEFADLGGSQPTVSDSLLVVPAGADDVADSQRVFSFFDNYGAPFWYPCRHAEGQLKDWGQVDGDEWTHTNSIVFLPEKDAYYLYARYFDAIVKVDRSTGTLLWQMGGEYGDFRHEDGSPIFDTSTNPLLWSHGHLSHLWDGGFLFYDNGNHREPAVSKVSEYTFDEQNRTVEEVWSFSDGRFMEYLSDAKKLNNGNVFLLNSPIAEMSEIQPDGTVVWRATMSQPIVGRVGYVADLYDTSSPLMNP